MPVVPKAVPLLTSLLALTALAEDASSRKYNGRVHADEIEVGSPVKTTSGLVHGHRAHNATTVSEYLGIPFAEPPVGPLRFAPPVRYHGKGDLSGNKHVSLDGKRSSHLKYAYISQGAICAQAIKDVPTSLPQNVYGILADQANVGQHPSEDCLTLNVWSKPQSGSAKKSVLVWIYGGGFSIGGTNTSSFSGQFWADEEDVVLVNFKCVSVRFRIFIETSEELATNVNSYRVGIFGFSGSPAATQNVGLLDQRMAIEWVRDNIAHFGGDPSRITIFGQSAGAASVDYYTYAWTKDPIIAGSISQSGEANAFGNKDPETAAMNWYNVTKAAGCGTNETSSDKDLLECMRKPGVDTKALLNAIPPATGIASVLSMYGPTVDGKTVFANYTEKGLRGDFIRSPAIVGNNDYEAGLFSKSSSHPQGFCYPSQFSLPLAPTRPFRNHSGTP